MAYRKQKFHLICPKKIELPKIIDRIKLPNRYDYRKFLTGIKYTGTVVEDTKIKFEREYVNGKRVWKHTVVPSRTVKKIFYFNGSWVKTTAITRSAKLQREVTARLDSIKGKENEASLPSQSKNS